MKKLLLITLLANGCAQADCVPKKILNIGQSNSAGLKNRVPDLADILGNIGCPAAITHVNIGGVPSTYFTPYSVSFKAAKKEAFDGIVVWQGESETNRTDIYAVSGWAANWHETIKKYRGAGNAPVIIMQLHNNTYHPAKPKARVANWNKLRVIQAQFVKNEVNMKLIDTTQFEYQARDFVHLTDKGYHDIAIVISNTFKNW